MKTFTCLLMALQLNYLAFADFSREYEVSRWTIQKDGNGEINLSNAPNSVSLRSPDDGTSTNDVLSLFLITVPFTTTLTFDWSYITWDGPGYDPVGYGVNGVYYKLTDDDGSDIQSGYNVEVNVNAGDIFFFYASGEDDCCGEGIITISNFGYFGSPLPVGFISFTAEVEGRDVFLKWNVSAGEGTESYLVQSSGNGIDFLPVARVETASFISDGMKTFHFRNYNVSAGVHYYRIRQEDKQGDSSYSSVIAVAIKEAAELSVFPNPFSGSTLWIEGGGAAMEVTLFSNKSEMVFQGEIASEESGKAQLNFPDNLKQGIYFMEIRTAGEVHQKRLLVQ